MLLAGGEGSRLWPLSRRGLPKQLLALDGEYTLLQQTVDRLAGLVPPERVVVVTAAAHLDVVRAQLPQVPSEQILGEPEGRSTLPAALWGTALAASRGATVVAVLPTDQKVEPVEAWNEALSRAFDAAQGSAVALVGVSPEAPTTALGWIRRPPQDDPTASVGFEEKPSLARAEALFHQGALWNAGVFVWRPEALWNRVRARYPALLEALAQAVALAPVEEWWPLLPAQSVDRGLIEGAAGLAVVEAAVRWRDLGTWHTLSELWPEREGGKGIVEAWSAVNCAGVRVFAPGKVVVALGVRDLVVIDTQDALLIASANALDALQGAVRQLDPSWK